MCGVICHTRTCTLEGLESIISHMMSRLLVLCSSYSLMRGPLSSLTTMWCFAANTHLDDILLLKSLSVWRQMAGLPMTYLFLFPFSSNSSTAKAEVCRKLQHCSQFPHLCVHMKSLHAVTVIMGPHVWCWQMLSTGLEQLVKLDYPHRMPCPYISSVLACLLLKREEAILQETLCD